jgi:hypothetical protein
VFAQSRDDLLAEELDAPHRRFVWLLAFARLKGQVAGIGTRLEKSSKMTRRHLLDYAGTALTGFAVIAASFAAGFGGWQAWIASDTAERQLRSYVYIGSLDLDLQGNPDGSSTFKLNPSLKVFGITPAAWVSPSWDLTILPVWSPGQFPRLPITAGGSDLVAVPGGDYRIGPKTLTLQKVDIQALQNRTKLIVSFGRITYNDVFGKPRWTDFCQSFDWDGAKTSNAELCPEHNDACAGE